MNSVKSTSAVWSPLGGSEEPTAARVGRAERGKGGGFTEAGKGGGAIDRT